MILSVLEVLKLFRLYDHVADKNNPTICCLDKISKLSRELSETNWLNEVNKKPKLRTYILIKKTLNPSEYVKSYMSKHKRSSMAQFLTGILPLKIETGRFNSFFTDTPPPPPDKTTPRNRLFLRRTP